MFTSRDREKYDNRYRQFIGNPSLNSYITLLKHFTGHYQPVIIFCDNARVRSLFIYFFVINNRMAK